MTFSWPRVFALARKDASELMRNPGAIIPPILMIFASLFPLFLVVFLLPMIMGKTLDQFDDIAEGAANAAGMIPELAGLSGNALIQTFLFHQFSLLLLLVPIVSATALATHAVIGEKQSKALEPLLATPISTIELLAAKTLTPFVFALGLTWVAATLEVVGCIAIGEPGLWRSIVGPRLFILFGVLGPLVGLLQVSVITSRERAIPAQRNSSRRC
jgi:ABC-2 type transport system permease protein